MNIITFNPALHLAEPLGIIKKNVNLRIITENQNKKIKADKIAKTLSELLGYKLLSVDPYYKFDNSFEILFETDKIDTNETLRVVTSICQPWSIRFDNEKNIELTFNKSESSEFHNEVFNVIKWAHLN